MLLRGWDSHQTPNLSETEYRATLNGGFGNGGMAMLTYRKSLIRGSIAAVALTLSFTSDGGQLATASAATVQTMCMAAGERTSGSNKICYYDCLGSAHAITQSSVSLCPLSVRAPTPGTAQRTPTAPQTGQTTCYARGEQTSGMNKICYYDCLGSPRAVTQSAVSLCALTIQQ